MPWTKIWRGVSELHSFVFYGTSANSERRTYVIYVIFGRFYTQQQLLL